MHNPKADLPAALTGLIVGAIALLIINFAIVKMVGSHHAKPEAGHVQH